ncbi:protein kinase [Nannocystis sp.]|uniref:nSTAND1 domain-containing NTPase n=1 Tax=Nannocystis sp. TaxID=1962667 RepID=UPI0025FD477E|nr:protein kinase [Nannocystis sp.]MBK7824538.1 protein kinase [Nannocystis sp.]
MASSQWTLPEQFDEYRIVRMLGRGSMGVVFLGHDLVLDRPVAIKFLNVVDASPKARERFLTEARAAARIQHPNVMAVHRVGELEGRLYIIGEYIRGQSLSELKRPVPWQELLKLGVGLARGLACAHRMGVLHRDIKLANAMRTETGEVKLLDFSLAKLLEAASVAELSQVSPKVPTELDATIDPESHSLPRVTIDAGAKGGRVVDSTLTASPNRSPNSGPLPAAPNRSPNSGPLTAAPPPAPTTDKDAALDSTLTRGHIAQAALQRVRINESSDATVVGTPYYMAPELWRAEPATRASDVYALGVLMYILGCGHPPIEGTSTLELARLTQETKPRPLRAVAPWVDARLAEIVDRCLRSPGERYPSADELCSALETLALGASPSEVVRGNPYRGLQAFEARHRGVFFGRGAEIRAVVDRLRAEPFVLVAGDSGVGKSSLCRAGVLPIFTDQAVDRRSWATISLMPGRRPLQTLVSALASTLSLQEEPLRDLLSDEPAELLRMIARRHGKDQGLIIFIDQLEELVTLADRSQLLAVGRFLAEVASDIPGVRLLATVRGDFLTRVAALPHIGLYINAAIYLLTPLSREGVREAIVGPARLQDVDFDSEALIEELVTAGAEGSLPLMQFALAELWEARDTTTRQITIHDLERIGRVTGALARHADNVVNGLPAPQRIAVRRLLMRLVTIEDTRASLPRDELINNDSAQEAALEALVRGRLVVVREAQDGTVYEIAHEALIRNWGTLQRWISDEREAREIRHRLELAALEWQRLGSERTGLWTAAQIGEANILERDSLRPRELAFLDASDSQVQRSRRIKLLAAISIPILAVAVFVGFRIQQARELARKVDEQLTQASASLEQARERQVETTRLRQQAFKEFDSLDKEGGNRSWTAATQAAAVADRQYRSAIQELELVLGLDANHRAGRELLADAFLERALAAEASGRRDLAIETAERLSADSPQFNRWHAPGQLSLQTTPPVTVTIAEYVQDPTTQRTALGAPRDLGPTPLRAVELQQGSYLLTLRISEALEIAYPLVIRREESLALSLPLPAPEQVPEGFVYVPEGRFLFGCPYDELICSFFSSPPQHEVETKAFLIARYETTYGDWLAFLRTLPLSDRAAFLPGDSTMGAADAGIRLTVEKDVWRLSITAGEKTAAAVEGQPLIYSERSSNAQQDWSRIPVSGIDIPSATAYLTWLDRSGRVPGARLCTDWEWERAARGADGRRFPHGEQIKPTDANILATYEKATAVGPDAVGLHPASRSPFGLDDMAGNVFEWMSSSLVAGDFAVRSGAFAYDHVMAIAVNRTVSPPEMRDSTIGLRVCATPRH